MRLFVAIELNAKTKKSLADLVGQLSDFDRHVRWVKVDRTHLTVKFLGDVPDDRVHQACQAASRAAARSKPFEMHVDHCGCFPNMGRVRVLWAGPHAAPQELLDCAAACEDEFAAIGFDRESRPFTAHLTLGRVESDNTGGRLRDAVHKVRVTKTVQPVSQLTVFQSVLGRGGPDYTVISKHPLGESQ